jgi:hypothetical protein
MASCAIPAIEPSSDVIEERSVPCGVVSLLDLMQRYRLDYLAVFLATCEMVSRDCGYMDMMGNPSIGSGEWSAQLARILNGLHISMKEMDGDKSLLAQIEAFAMEIYAGRDNRPSVIKAGLKPIMLGVEKIIENRLFMFVPEDQAAYYMNIKHFGDAVGMFPDAIDDMLETSNCYAFGRATACIFHAMRVAEHGLRFIAASLKVKTGTKRKPLPIEYATWEAVLIEI